MVFIHSVQYNVVLDDDSEHEDAPVRKRSRTVVYKDILSQMPEKLQVMCTNAIVIITTTIYRNYNKHVKEAVSYTQDRSRH